MPRAQPNVAAGAQVDRGPELRGVTAAQRAARAVGEDQRVGVTGRGFIRDLALEMEFYAHLAGSRLKDLQQAHAAEAGEALTARA